MYPRLLVGILLLVASLSSVAQPCPARYATGGLYQGLAKMVASFNAMAIEPSPGTPEQFRSYIAAQYAHCREQSRHLDNHLG